MQLKLVPLLPTNVVQAKAEDYFPESTRATTNTWPYYRYRETAGKLDLVELYSSGSVVYHSFMNAAMIQSSRSKKIKNRNHKQK